MVKKIKSNKPIYAIGIVWILYASLFPFYKMSHILIAGGCSVLAYILISLKFPPVEVTSIPEYEPIETGNLEADRLLEQGRGYLRQIREIKTRISQREIINQINSLETITERIFSIIVENPSKVIDIKIFMSYYLPTTVKLIDSYATLSKEEDVGGKNIKGTLRKIENDLSKIVESFRNLLDGMYTEHAMDISTDITVMQNMLEQQGYLSQNTIHELSALKKENDDERKQ